MNHPRLYHPTSDQFLELCSEAGVSNWDEFSIAVKVLQLVQQKQEELLIQEIVANGSSSSPMQEVPLQPDAVAPHPSPRLSPPRRHVLAPLPTPRPNLPLHQQMPPPPSILNAEDMVVKRPVLRRSQRLIEKKESSRKLFELEEAMVKERRMSPSNGTGVGLKRKAERAWSTSPSVSHGDCVANVKEREKVKEEEGSMVEEDEELLAVPLPDYEENEEHFLKKESKSSLSSPLPYSPQGHYKVGMYPSNATIANWKHPTTGFSLKKAQNEVSREFQRNRCKWQGRINADRGDSDTESEREFHLRCQQMSPSPPHALIEEDDAEMDHSENNLRTIWGGGFQDWV